MLDFVEQNEANLHSILVLRHGRIALEAYADPFDAETPHELHTATSTVLGALVGIAIEQGYLAGVDQPLLSFFPQHTSAASDPLKASITIEHLLTMTSGLTWLEMNEFYRYPTNSVNQMMASEDWVQFVLDRPMAVKPGSTYAPTRTSGRPRSVLNSGGSHLLSAILQAQTGQTALDYAQTRLFGPLGISDVTWAADPAGITVGGLGLSLTPRDMAKFGQLYLNQGVWNGQPVVPAEWVRASFEPYGMAGAHFLEWYGYHWWIHQFAYSATGYGGQYIFVIPEKDMVVVFTGGLKWNVFLPMRLVEFFILPAAQSAESLPENSVAHSVLLERTREYQNPTPDSTLPLPPVAQTISGIKYQLLENSLGWQALSLDFSDRGTTLALSTAAGEFDLAVGMDGVYRVSEHMPAVVALKGRWVDDEFFEIYYQVLGEIGRYDFEFRFDDRAVEIRVQEIIEGGQETIRGHVP